MKIMKLMLLGALSIPYAFLWVLSITSAMLMVLFIEVLSAIGIMMDALRKEVTV